MLLLTPVVAAAIGIYLITQNRPSDAGYLFLTSVGSLAVTGLFIHPCRYTLLKDTMGIRCGILAYQVPYDEIESIEKSGTWVSGPALSMKRVLIRTKHRNFVVSPKFRDEFMDDLSQAANCRIDESPNSNATT